MTTDPVKLPRPNNGLELAQALGVESNEGVQVALFPDTVEDVSLTGESFDWDKNVRAWGLVGNLGPWGPRLLDVVTEPDVDVKWWKVREFAKTNGFDHVPIRWEGAVVDIPDRYFAPGTILGVRMYNHGPWFWPLEQPTISEAADPEVDTIAIAVDAFNQKNYPPEGQ